MSSHEGGFGMAGFNPVLDDRRLSWSRLWPPRPMGRTAVVLERRRGGYLLVTPEQTLSTLDFKSGGYWHAYHVDLTPRELPTWYELPSREPARPFRADLRLSVQVADAVKVVEQGISDAWDGLEPVLRKPLRQIGRQHGPDELATVEAELHAYLTGLTVSEVGLRILRAAVSVDLQGPDLKREMEKLEAQHRRELDELNAKHRTRLEKAEAQHQRELHEQYERHQHILEAQRRKLYEEVVGEGLLPKLLLMKLGARAAGGDQKDLDEVIDLITKQRVDDFQVPLDLLARYNEVIERWQLEEPVGALLKHLIATYVPQTPPRLPDVSEGHVTVTVGEHEPAGSDNGEETENGPSPDDQPGSAAAAGETPSP
jgi:hypothetical protein